MKKLALILFVLVPVIAFAYSGGPPDEKTGAPGEGTCIDCHFGNPLNSGDGSFTIDGPENFMPGETYTFVVTLSDPDQSRWGFELTPLELGSITITDETNTQQSTTNNKSYVKHTFTGTYDEVDDGPVSWSFDWTAPEDPPEEITFYAAGNAANGNGNTTGDFIYTTTFTSMLQVSGIEDEISLPGQVTLGNYPNPFNASTIIQYNVPKRGFVSLTVYDLLGKKLTTLVNGYQDSGNRSVTFNADNYPSGLYLYRLSVGGETQTRVMTLIK